MQPEPDLKKIAINKFYGISIPMLLSLLCHACLAVGLVYATITTQMAPFAESDLGISIVRLNLASIEQPQVAAVNVEKTDNQVDENPAIVDSDIVLPPVTKAKIAAAPKKKQHTPVNKTQNNHKPLPINETTSMNSNHSKMSDTVGEHQVQTNEGSSTSSGGIPLSKIKPIYPERARAMGIEGEVKVCFDINEAGRVNNIKLISETPKNMFFKEVRKALLRWQYAAQQPIFNKELRFSFSLTNDIEIK